MKNFIRIQLVALFGVLILSACSTSNDVVSNNFITKRKHNKGFHLNLKNNYSSQKGEELAKSEKVSKKEIINTENEVVIANNETANITVASANDNVFMVESTVETPSFENAIVEKAEIAADTKTVKNVKSNKENETVISKSVLKKIVNKTKKGGDIPTGLLYVLAFFIPWLAVGLVTDWDIKTVVINLLWTCLCGIPGIIHAFIVVARES